MSKYTRLDDWIEAKDEFIGAIGDEAWDEVSGEFGQMDGVVEAMDEEILAWVETLKRGSGATDTDSLAMMEEEIHAIKTRMKVLMRAWDDAENELEERLLDQLAETEENIDAVEDLISEANASEKFILLAFNQGLKILTGKHVKKKQVNQEIKDLKGKLERTMFLGDGRWSAAMERANDKIKEVQRLLKTFSELPDVVQREADNIRDVITAYNSNLPSSGTGVRSVTTYMKGFLEMEYIFAAVDKNSSSMVKNLVPGKKIKTYSEYRKFLKVAGRAIKALSPWANATNALDADDYIGMEPDDILGDLRLRLLKCKKILAKLNSIFLRFD